MTDDREKINQLVKAKTSSLQKTSSNIISRGFSDLSLLTIESDDLKYTQSNVEAYFNRGNAYYNKGQYDRAIEDFNKAIALNPNSAEAYKAYNNRGNAYINKGQYDRAIENYTKAIALNPNHADDYNNRGLAYNAKGQYDRAIENYTKAIALNPNHARAYYNRGNAYHLSGNMDGAIFDFQKACDMGLEKGCENLQRVLKERQAL